MDLNVKIVKILDAQSYVSKSNNQTYVTRFFVGETTNTQYPKMVAFKVFSEDKFNAMGIVVGGTYNVSFDVESREWNGKYFTECQAWRAVRVDVTQAQNANNSGTQQANPQPQPQPAPQPQQEADPMPF
jgi:hypothetical protein